MDLITLAMAKAYSDSKGGYTDAKTLTYDGNKEGKDVFVDLDGVDFVRIGNAIDIHTITKVKLNSVEIDASELELGSVGGADFVAYSGTIGVYVFSDDKNNNSPSGTYVLDYGGYVITRIETETIHPIDPKFLPGVCLPVVVNLSKYEASGQTFSALIEGLVMNGGGTVSVDVEQFMKDASTDGVLILELEVMGATIRTSAVTSMLNHFDYTTEQLCFSTLVDMGTGLMNVSVLIDRFNTDGSITVAVS